jgi:polyphenol oxidase
MSKFVFMWSRVGDGNMSLKYGDKETVIKNRQKFLGNIDPVILSLSGGTEIAEVTKNDCGKMIEADAAITNEVGVGLFMVVGDCFPVVIFDPTKNMLAMVHCGRSGIEGKIVNRVIERLSDKGVNASNLVVKIGPGIRKESYVVDEQHIDLLGLLMKQLDECGVKSENIEDCGIDTYEDTNYFSHYRAKRNNQSEGRFGVVSIII